MLQAAFLTVALLGSASNAVDAPVSNAPVSPVAQCLGTMDGAVYHGDPSDRHLMNANVATCTRAIKELAAMRPAQTAQGPEKLFIEGRILDRAATLSYMGLGDATTAQREVIQANLYFRVAAGLVSQPQTYRDAANANVKLTRQQLHTLRTDLASVVKTRTLDVARSTP